MQVLGVLRVFLGVMVSGGSRASARVVAKAGASSGISRNGFLENWSCLHPSPGQSYQHR